MKKTAKKTKRKSPTASNLSVDGCSLRYPVLPVQAVVHQPAGHDVLPTEINVDLIKRKMRQIQEFQEFVRRNLQDGKDYGVIKGVTKKPCLFKPGAEKIIKLLDLADTWEFVDRTETWPGTGEPLPPFFNYTMKVKLISLISGQVVSEGIGSANSHESKFGFRWVGKRELGDIDPKALKTRIRRGSGGGEYTQYRVANDDIASLQNSILKMAKKRAMVDAALAVGRLSNIFTQDLDDLDDHYEGPPLEPEESEPPPFPHTPSQTPRGKAAKAKSSVSLLSRRKAVTSKASKNGQPPSPGPGSTDRMVSSAKVESALKFIRTILKERGMSEDEFLTNFFQFVQPLLQKKRKDPGYSPVVAMAGGAMTWNGLRGGDIVELSSHIKKTISFMLKKRSK